MLRGYCSRGDQAVRAKAGEVALTWFEAALDWPSLCVASPAAALGVACAGGAGGAGRGGGGGGCCARGGQAVRAKAGEVVLTWFEELFGPDQARGEPSAKRPRISSKLLGALDGADAHAALVAECAAMAAADSAGEIADSARERAAACLSRGDMGIRLAESFLLAICIPVTSKMNRSMSVCASAFLDLLFRGLRSQERFREVKLRDSPLDVDLNNPAMLSSKLLSKTRTYQGTFLSSMNRRPQKQAKTYNGIDVQIPIDDILGTLLTFAKDKPDMSQTLAIEVTRSILATGRGFESAAKLARVVCDVLSSTPCEVTPLAVEVARLIVGDMCSMLDSKPSLEKLRKVTICTEGEGLVQLLIEESRLRSDSDILQIGTTFDPELYMEQDLGSPSLEALTSAFGSLSNWDKLTQRKRDQVCSALPQLWVDLQTFKTWMDDYQVISTKSWFNKLVSSYRDMSERDSLRCLRETDRWPRRLANFDGTRGVTMNMRECLVESAARIMLRRAFADTEDSDSSGVGTNRLDELMWVRAANERGLPQLALNCIDVHESLLEPTEEFPWRIEKATAMRLLGLRTHDLDMLGDALTLIETNEILPQDTSKSDIIAMNKLYLSLHQDLGSLSNGNVERVMETVGSYTKSEAHCLKDKKMMGRLFEIAVNFYDDCWSDDSTEQNKILSNMADVLGHIIDLDLPGRAEMFLSVILNRLDEVTTVLEEDTARNILEKTTILGTLDETTSELLSGLRGVFPTGVKPPAFAPAAPLPLLPAPTPVLLRTAAALKNCCKDPEGWKKTFAKMRSIFDDPDATGSPEYIIHNKYKNDLYQIEDFESTTPQQKTAILNSLIQKLNVRLPLTTLRLSSLCPALARRRYAAYERDGDMPLRGLGPGRGQFYDEVTIINDAVNSPMVLTELLPNGTTRRYIHKTGDQLRIDASALRVAKAAAALWEGNMLTYGVTPLKEDSGLIEFVENTQRLRSLIKTQFELGQVDIGARAEDEELILASSSLEHHHRLCRQVPSYALRSAIEAHSSSTEDFINKKQTYLETLSAITIFSWLFGLGDRHLENLLYRSCGSLVCVDWAALLQYGTRDLPPARLTRNVLAVCDVEAFEANLQRLVTSLRDSHKLFLNYVKSSFKWMGEEFLEKFPYIEQYSSGHATSRDVTKRALLSSSRRYKDRIVALLDGVFEDLEVKDQYSVGDQVTCLLRQCTNDRILSVTRSGYEPWV